MTKSMPRLLTGKKDKVSFFWNGRKVDGQIGDSVASALHAAGHKSLAHSRKFHEPRGLSGSYVAGHAAQVDGAPHVRLDKVAVSEGLKVQSQHVWPSARFDLLSFSRFVPRKWLRAGFENPKLIPDGTRIWNMWERMLWHVAGEVDISSNKRGTVVGGKKIKTDLLIVGGGPSGIDEARNFKGEVLLITRGEQLGGQVWSHAADGPDLPKNVTVLTEHEVFGIFEKGRVVLAAPNCGHKPAIAIEACEIRLAIGKKSLPPLVPGAALPGVMDAHAAHHLAARKGVAPGRNIVVVGTDAGHAVAEGLKALGCNVVAFVDVNHLQRIRGSKKVNAVITKNGAIKADCVVHAGPWVTEPSLGFQAGADGYLRLLGGQMPDHISVVGSAGQPDETYSTCANIHRDTLICPCMDVTAAEIFDLIRDGVTHPEEIKRRTGCGMGPCQGFPCWHGLAGMVTEIAGAAADDLRLPTFRPPRAALTLGQAAGLADVTEVEP